MCGLFGAATTQTKIHFQFIVFHILFSGAVAAVLEAWQFSFRRFLSTPFGSRCKHSTVTMGEEEESIILFPFSRIADRLFSFGAQKAGLLFFPVINSRH